MVDEQVLAAFVGCDEPEALGGVEPLHSAYCHFCMLSDSTHVESDLAGVRMETCAADGLRGLTGRGTRLPRGRRQGGHRGFAGRLPSLSVPRSPRVPVVRPTPS